MGIETFTHIEKDATRELMNIGMARATHSLSRLTRTQVDVSIPELDLEKDPQHMGFTEDEKLSIVYQTFDGGMLGASLLLFPRGVARKLVNVMLQTNLNDDILEETEKDAFLEIGNIILNACIGSLGNMLKCKLASGLPNYFQGNFAEAKHATGMKGKYAMYLNTRFKIATLDIDSYVTIVLDANSLAEFHSLLKAYLDIYNISV
ncbi:hypothetical protein A9Q99_18590 [Gammaproteobacteria bacterium 45_16_T64]|nr:hypothetical protein A9Q99_18590 [Gammaproteobacteria bacterium 45_16_T64]